MKKNVILLILFSLLVPKAWAFQYTYEGNTLKYTVIDENNKYVSVRGVNKNMENLIIPEKVYNGSIEYTVTEVESYGFRFFRPTSITFPKSLKVINTEAFYSSPNLKEIVFHSDNVTINDNAFNLCSALTTINCLGHINSIGFQAFYNCPLNDISFQQTTPPIFARHDITRVINKDISSIHFTIPDGTINDYIYIWHHASLNFYEKNSNIFSKGGLVYIPITANEVSVYGGVFDGGSVYPENLVLEDDVTHLNGKKYNITTIDSVAFVKGNITSVKLGNNIKKIGKGAFARVVGMTNKTIVFPSSLEYIANNAFLGCASTYEFTSNELPELGEEVFDIFSTNDDIDENDGRIKFIVPSCEAFQSVTTNWDYPFFTDYASAKNTDKCSFNLSSKGENITNIPSNENQEHFGKITYTRTFTPGVWETLYLPFELEDMTVTVQGVYDGKPFSVNNPWNNNKGGYFHLAQLGSDGYFEYIQDDNAKLKGKNPYIIQFPSEDFKDVPVTFSSKDNYNHIPNSFEQADPTSDYAMYANTTLQPQELNNPAYYLGTDNNFKHTGTYTLQPFECYLTPIVETQSYVNPRMMSVRFRPQSGVTTDVPTINNNPLLCQRNGNTLIIQTNGNPVNIYNINGLLLHSFAEGQEEVSVTLNSGCYIINSLGYTEKIIF